MFKREDTEEARDRVEELNGGRGGGGRSGAQVVEAFTFLRMTHCILYEFNDRRRLVNVLLGVEAEHPWTKKTENGR